MSEEKKKDGEERPGSSQPGNLAELYEKMSKVVRENLERAGMLTEDAFERALQESREWAYRMKDHYGDDISRVSEFIRRDWHEGIRYTREQMVKSFNFDRIQAGLLGVLFRLAEAAGSQLESFASKLKERLTYKTGEIAGAGTLECGECGQTLLFDKPTRIPPCPKCRGTVFTRSF